MAKFQASMLPPRPPPRRVCDLAVGQTRYVSESDLDSLKDGTALLSVRASVFSHRSYLHPVAVTKAHDGWRVEVPRDFKIRNTRSYRPPGHEEIGDLVIGNAKPEPTGGDVAVGLLGLLVTLGS